MKYPNTKQGIAKFTKDILEPLVQQFGYGSCIYEKDYRDTFIYYESLVIRDLDGHVCSVINVTGDSCSACARDLFKQFLIKE
jgi:hypothetical protein